jgi:hypothetical protein
LREFVRPRNLSKLSRYRDRCQPFEITGFPLDFNNEGGIQCGIKPKLSTAGDLFTARPKTRFHFDSPQNPAHAEAEDDAKIKDRLEALLFAETLQGTLSPNANPGKGSVGGLLNWMPKATARIQRAAQTHQSLVLDSIFYTKPQGVAQEENQKSYLQCAAEDFRGGRGAATCGGDLAAPAPKGAAGFEEIRHR